MKLEYVNGCICTSLAVDGKEFNIDLTIDQRRDIAHKIVNKCTKPDELFTKIYMDEDKSGIVDYNTVSTLSEKREKIIQYIENPEADNDYLYQEVFISYLELEGEYEYLGHCEVCGDCIIKYSIEL